MGGFSKTDMGSLMKVITGKIDSLPDITRVLLGLSKGNPPYGFEDAMRLAGSIDKLEERFAIMGFAPKKGFRASFEAACELVPREAPLREKLLFLWLAYLIYKAADASRASKAREDSGATQDIEKIEEKEQHILNLIRQGSTPLSFKSSLSAFAKHEGALRKEDEINESAKQRTIHGSAVQQPAQSQVGCANFVLRGQCSYGASCKFSHSDQAKCPRGSACTFVSSPKGCAFVGPNSH
jgi:hypothetical protein